MVDSALNFSLHIHALFLPLGIPIGFIPSSPPTPITPKKAYLTYAH